MTDYISSFKQGLNAAKEAGLAKKEINIIFDDLNRQINEASKSTIEITIKSYEFSATHWASKMANLLEPQRKEIKFYIVAYNPKVPDGPVKKLAQWDEARSGYPCKLTWGNQVRSCEDREALENSLETLLSDAKVGEYLQTLINLEPTEGKEETGESVDEEINPS